MAKSIWEDKPICIMGDVYFVKGKKDVYEDDCMACKYSRSSPFMSPSAKCSLKNIECGWGYTCKKFEKR